MSLIRNVLNGDPLKIEKDIERNESSIEVHEQQIEEIRKRNEEIRLIINPPINRKRKLDLIFEEEKRIGMDLLVTKKIKKDAEIKIRELEESLQKIDHKNCLALFDQHQLEDVEDKHYGGIKYSQCRRCGYIERFK